MNSDLSSFMDHPWGVAIAVLVLLIPRVLVRIQDPLAMRRLSGPRLFLGHVCAVATALAAFALAEPLQVRPWLEATPLRSVRELASSPSVAAYLCAALIAWLFSAYLVVPIVAWLGSHGRVNGLLVAGICLPVATAMGVALSLAWPEPSTELMFSLASAWCLALAVALGFSFGARLPLSVRLRVAAPEV